MAVKRKFNEIEAAQANIVTSNSFRSKDVVTKRVQAAADAAKIKTADSKLSGNALSESMMKKLSSMIEDTSDENLEVNQEILKVMKQQLAEQAKIKGNTGASISKADAALIGDAIAVAEGKVSRGQAKSKTADEENGLMEAKAFTKFDLRIRKKYAELKDTVDPKTGEKMGTFKAGRKAVKEGFRTSLGITDNEKMTTGKVMKGIGGKVLRGGLHAIGAMEENPLYNLASMGLSNRSKGIFNAKQALEDKKLEAENVKAKGVEEFEGETAEAAFKAEASKLKPGEAYEDQDDGKSKKKSTKDTAKATAKGVGDAIAGEGTSGKGLAGVEKNTADIRDILREQLKAELAAERNVEEEDAEDENKRQKSEAPKGKAFTGDSLKEDGKEGGMLDGLMGGLGKLKDGIMALAPAMAMLGPAVAVAATAFAAWKVGEWINDGIDSLFGEEGGLGKSIYDFFNGEDKDDSAAAAKQNKEIYQGIMDNRGKVNTEDDATKRLQELEAQRDQLLKGAKGRGDFEMDDDKRSLQLINDQVNGIKNRMARGEFKAVPGTGGTPDEIKAQVRETNVAQTKATSTAGHTGSVTAEVAKADAKNKAEERMLIQAQTEAAQRSANNSAQLPQGTSSVSGGNGGVNVVSTRDTGSFMAGVENSH